MTLHLIFGGRWARGQRYAWTEAQWVRSENLLLGQPGAPGRSGAATRLCGNAVRWGLRAGAPGSARPPRSGQWQSVHKRVTRGAQAGVWARGFDPPTTERDKDALLRARTLGRAQQQAAPGKGGAGIKRWGVPEAACRPNSTSPATPSGARSGGSARPDRPALRHGPGR